MNIYVSEVIITVLGTVIEDPKTKKREFTPTSSVYTGLELPLVIDGLPIRSGPFKRLVINRLLKSDGEQASVPI